jgi:quercetin dioxygenase-like cupin family protein
MEQAKMESQVSRLAELTAYQEGSIVSRQIINKPTGTVTLFAFDCGQQLSEHTAAYDAAAIVLEGEAQIQIAGRPYVLGAGDFIIMPANQPHAVRAEKQFKMLLVMIRS